MSSHWLRDASVLVVVFGWLDKFVMDKDGPTLAWSVGIGAIGLILFWIGGKIQNPRRH